MKSLFLCLTALFMVAMQPDLQAKDDKKKSDAFAGGIVYSLPRTMIRIKVVAEQELIAKGPYAIYAPKYLGVKEVALEDKENWILKSVEMESFGEPDPAAVYKASGTVAALLSLSDEGVLLGVNSKVASEPEQKPTTTFLPRESLGRVEWNNVSMHSFLTVKDTSSRKGDEFKDPEEKAAEAAHDILKMRKKIASNLSATGDQLPPDGKAYEVMMNELPKILAEYEALFVGKSLKKTHTFYFEVAPEGKNKPVVAFRFSPTIGVLPVNNVSGRPVMLEVEPTGDMAQKAEAETALMAGEGTTKGLFYRIPAIASVKLINGTEVLSQMKTAVAQMGVIAPMPESLLTGQFSIELHGTTGAIKKISTF